MARNRMIKPEFWEDEEMALLSFPARLLYIAMWNFADDEGFIKTHPEWLKAKCFPYDKVNIKTLLDEILKIKKLEISNTIAKIINFSKHQKIDRPNPSALSSIYRRVIDDSSSPKISKDKISEVKIREMAVVTFNFDDVWMQYPKKIGRKEAEKHFSASVKNQKDFDDICTAVKNYEKHTRTMEARFIQHGSTWFNNWRDWVDYKEPIRSAGPVDKSHITHQRAKDLAEKVKQLTGATT